MATILEFRSAPRPAPAQMLAGGMQPAEIVFFPGVRYERPAEETDPKAKRKHRRDTLELES